MSIAEAQHQTFVVGVVAGIKIMLALVLVAVELWKDWTR